MRQALVIASTSLLLTFASSSTWNNTALAALVDEVINWNAIANSVTPAAGKNGPQQTRVYAMVQLAVHDALNAIEPRYESYAYEPSPDPTASAPAAIATAARLVLLAEVATQSATIDTAYATSLSLIPPGPAKDAGIAIGQGAAEAILQARALDGAASADIPYVPGTGPGLWRPTPNPFPANPPPPNPGFARAVLPGWGNVLAFALNHGAQFQPDGPPALTSDEYAQDYNEVKDIGEQNSPFRTAEQSEIARYWYEASGPGWNRITRIVAAQQGLDMWDAARLLALVNVAMADGFIAGFNTRYIFNFWRPVTAIREGDTDDNPNTIADPAWNTYLNTPAIPDYPSTHSVSGGAAAEVLQRFFGTDEIPFTMTSGAPFAGLTRSFTSFSQAAQENADSRVYAGIHFRTACRDGVRLGRKIGGFSYQHYLEPRRAKDESGGID